MIIIPDIHGRIFWKNVVKSRENETIVFLGDYTDPYPNENISKEECLQNFIEIIEFKKQHIKNVILLLGNHDFGYINNNMISCRHDYTNHDTFKKLFEDNKDLFQIVYSYTINDKKYLFTHSGINDGWWKWYLDEPKEAPDTYLNGLYQNNLNQLCILLNCIDFYRGGYESFGSCVWNDVRGYDIDKESEFFPNTYQIFGHTQLIDKPIIGKWKCCVDCRCGFELNNNGDIQKIGDE